MLAALVGAGLTASASSASSGTPTLDPTEFAPDPGVDEDIPNSKSTAHVPSAQVPRPTSTPVDGAGPAISFLGLNFFDQRTADGGNQFSVEPPDQGLCVGDGGYVMEAVNDVFTFYQGGNRLFAPQAFNPFFTGDHAIIRSTPPVYGTFISDPRCYFDPGLHRFFFTVVSLDRNPSTGAFTGPSHVELAVSKSATPTTSPDNWYHYRITTTNAGPDAENPGLPNNANCPCFGDQPLIGADQYGFFVSTNEFTVATPRSFNGGIVYAMDKAALASGSLHNLTIVANHPPLAENVGYTIQPATSPTTADWQTANNGTEYFLSALEFTGGLDNRIAVWAATNTHSLTTSTPNVHLTNAVLTSEVYGQPPNAEQRPGPYPLGQSLKEHENLIASNDDRMQQTVYVRPPGDTAGKLFSSLNTVVKTENGPTHVGSAWFIVTPSVTGSGSTTNAAGSIANQGYVSVNQENLLFPAIGVNHAGLGAMTFTLVGPDYYPSAAETTIDLSGTGPTVDVPGPGQRPADGFSGYRFYGASGVERWGDYSAATADAAGTIWLATEYIKGDVVFPPYLANWDTRVMSLTR